MRGVLDTQRGICRHRACRVTRFKGHTKHRGDNNLQICDDQASVHISSKRASTRGRPHRFLDESRLAKSRHSIHNMRVSHLPQNLGPLTTFCTSVSVLSGAASCISQHVNLFSWILLLLAPPWLAHVQWLHLALAWHRSWQAAAEGTFVVFTKSLEKWSCPLLKQPKEDHVCACEYKRQHTRRW